MYRRGSSVIEIIIATSVAVLITNLLVMCYHVISLSEKFDESIQDEIAFNQLRLDLCIGYDFDVHNDSLLFKKGLDTHKLSVINNRLVMQPGTVIYVNDIDSSYFYKEDQVLYICYYRKNIEYKRAIAYE